jgi:glycosyltransferase involved in cell wall biosynthesis
MGSPPHPASAPRVPRALLVSMDPVGGAMAGQGIRCLEIARALSREARVAIAAPAFAGELPAGIERIAFSPHAPRALRGPIAAADLILAPPQWPVVARWLARSRAQVVFDLYDPETLETLELFADSRPPMQRLMVALTLDRLGDALRIGDRFVCASESQRDLWLGALLRSRAITPELHSRDPTLRDLVDTVPSGVPANPPVRGRGPGPRGLLAGVGEDGELVLWNGGIWRWLDAPTAIRAVALLAERRPALRLIFMGASRHPAAAAATREARELAASLGLLDSVVHFHDRWVPYDERADWLLDADCALSTHRDHVEARFAWRTRILDCFWAGLPVVCTAGDDLAARVAREELGATAPPADPAALADAIAHVLDRGRDAYAERLAHAAGELAWPRLCAPLLRWLAHPPATRRQRGRRGSVPRSAGHRVRRAVYMAGGRMILANRPGAAGRVRSEERRGPLRGVRERWPARGARSTEPAPPPTRHAMRGTPPGASGGRG